MHRNPYRYNFCIGKIIALNQQIEKIFFLLLKMQQLNKISILETVALMRGTRIRQSAMFAERQTRRSLPPEDGGGYSRSDILA